jgi:protein-disulfide isomerase
VSITRREFLEGTASLALAAGVVAALPAGGFDLISTAFAQAVSNDELMKPAALPDQVQGAANAPVTIIEYASMTCSHCAAFHKEGYPVLKSKYIDTGKVRYILREFPLDPLAAGGFMLARCAGEGKYYPVVETLFEHQKDWAFVQNPIPPLLKIAKQFGLTEQSFEQCLSNQKMLDGIEEVRQRGQKLGVNSTPTFFINGKIYRGALSVSELDKQIAPLLKGS